ncbi:hypothetical protein [Alloactinosynnema sp. L-07]|uniref:hypothetical protein n=1 Tax=Alloactinosynnema sp. L-07 TaxID=1653480 RepID=UPI00065EFC78|nr:hypothetical protein [Alloactinosynnema sp. L-07]CRK61577.1 hypothetical protein [Alloactinosynnema sp. L-07]
MTKQTTGLGRSMIAAAGLMVGLTMLSAVPATAAPAAPASTQTAAVQQVFLGYEYDACSGSLKVKNKYGTYVPITRGVWTTVDVAINGDGYWFWKCGSSVEYSRGEPNYRPRVKRLRVYHSTQSSSITWKCYDLL